MEEEGGVQPVNQVESTETSQGAVSWVITNEWDNLSSAEEAVEERRGSLHVYEALKSELNGPMELGALLEEYHEVGKEDRGETDLVEL